MKWDYNFTKDVQSKDVAEVEVWYGVEQLESLMGMINLLRDNLATYLFSFTPVV